MDYDRICKDILNLDKKIRFAAICDDAGETRYGGMREGMSSLLTPEETRKSVQLAIGRWGLRDALYPKIGKAKYAMAEYEKIKRVSIPLNDDYLLLVSMDIDTDHSSLIYRILDLIKQWVKMIWCIIFLVENNVIIISS